MAYASRPGNPLVERLLHTFIEHSQDLFKMSAAKYQLTKRLVMRLSGRPGLYEYEGLPVGLITQDVK